MIDLKKITKNGFDVLFSDENFKCAFITKSEDYSFGSVRVMKRHENTDEIFVLLCGKAVILTFENDRFRETELIEKQAYNVKKSTWHYLALEDDAVVFVVEKSDTDATNSQMLKLDKEYILKY